MSETLANKLNAVLNTKGAIKAAMRSQGVDVPENAPFSQYPDLIAGMQGLTELTTGTVSISPQYGESYLCTGASSITVGTPAAPSGALQKARPITIRWNCAAAPSVTLSGAGFVWANGEIPVFGPCGEISIAYGGDRHFVLGSSFIAAQ